MANASPSGPLGVDAVLGSMLSGVYAGAPSLSEGRRLAFGLLGIAWNAERGHAPRSSPAPALGAIDDLDDVLAVVKECSNLPGVIGVSDAKEWLRSYGARGVRAASLVGKLSRGRNVQSHPLRLQLLAEVRQLASDGGGSESPPSTVGEAPLASFGEACADPAPMLNSCGPSQARAVRHIGVGTSGPRRCSRGVGPSAPVEVKAPQADVVAALGGERVLGNLGGLQGDGLPDSQPAHGEVCDLLPDGPPDSQPAVGELGGLQHDCVPVTHPGVHTKVPPKTGQPIVVSGIPPPYIDSCDWCKSRAPTTDLIQAADENFYCKKCILWYRPQARSFGR